MNFCFLWTTSDNPIKFETFLLKKKKELKLNKCSHKRYN